MSPAELFDFDLWANRKWMAHLESIGWPEPDRGIFQHILAAQEIWATRCQGTSLEAMPTPEVTEGTMVRLHAAWKELVQTIDPGQEIGYRRTTGEALQMPFAHICRHVIDHGTYHRGELRGLCRARSDESFPESGYGGFVFDVGLGKVLG